ncbi:flippase activity-associated protein Agl23 [Halorarius halobius]|uniref:flippase activity-associated protein Agl23 n=1 Tax=Halorarius halobius TaxID=2962671 RepID=UPI0020CBD1A9|nr:flippase activity-associated protein Agl23 [Halorarius halobius]
MTDGSRFDDRVVRVVAAIALLGLVARLLLLGDRIAHFDEARVAWWTHHFAASGQFHYRYIIHGPFIQHVDRALFGLLGATDFSSRLPVAVVGGLLPLVALWFRHRLSETEVGALALLLAANPILLYYSRFMRSTLLVAAFCFVAFAAFVRWYDGFGVRYFHLGLVALGLGFAAKENAIVYVLCWLGAGALVLHHKMYRHRGADSGSAWLASAARSTRRRLVGPDWSRLRFSVAHLAGGVVLFGLVVLFFYAPREGVTSAGALAITPDHPNYQQVVDTCRQTGLWSSLAAGDIGSLFQCTELTIQRGYGYWFGGSSETTVTTYVERLGKFISTSARYAGPLLALALAGFLIEQYATDDTRHLVVGVAYWGAASVVGYPLGTDIWAAWIIVNALVPLALPAAVGLGYILDAGRDALADEDRVSVGLVAVLLVLVGGVMLSTGISAVYLNPTEPDNELVQFAQPEQDMRPAVAETLERAGASDGPDALFYGGSDFVDMDEQATRTPACINWFRTLPWAWYLSPNGVDVTCANDTGTLPEEMPPVVVAQAECTLDRNVECRERPAALEVDSRLSERIPADYERQGFLHRSTGGSYFDGMVVFYESET